MATRDYSSIYSIKEFALKEVAPKFFDMATINQLNVGLLGYSTELSANMTEDTFNSVSTYVKEMFPNQAQIPETLYNFASIFQIENLFATPAEINMAIFVSEKDIAQFGERKESVYEFVLDSDLIVDIEGQQFMLDYDILITAKPYAGSMIYTAQYKLDHKNSISAVINPYIKTTSVNMNGSKYLGLLVKMHRVNKFEQLEQVINNDKINLPTISVEFIDQLANFEVFYKPPGASDYTQLKKKMFGTPPIAEPFCFYRIKDENRIELTFTVRDNYFQPEFNSELLIRTYTTTGKDGNFPEYKGTNITVIASSDVYDYNNNVIVFALPQGESVYGKDRLSLEELRTKIIELSSTSGAYNVENDLQLYFANYENIERNTVLFVKKRDDALERLFAAFAIFKDLTDDFYPTNTLNLDMYKENFDLEYEQSNRFILKAGHLFKYDKTSKDKAVMIDQKITDDLTKIPDEFLYTNPFLITLQKNPSVVGFYLNSVNDKIPLEYTYVNGSSLVQFICNNLVIKRNALIGEDGYKMSVSLIPTSPLELPVIENGAYNGRLKIMMAFEDSGAETCFIELGFKSFDAAANIFTFESVLQTDDYMTIAEKFSVQNVISAETGLPEVKLIPMRDCIVNFHAFFKYDGMVLPHKYNHLEEFADYTLTNTYSASNKKVTFITPLDIMRARVKYSPRSIQGPEGEPPINDYYMHFAFVPLVGARVLKEKMENFYDFLSLLYSQHDYLQGIVDKKTNNYGIDLKFYNTFGRSKNFVVGEDGQTLDKTNITIQFKVAPTVGALDEDLIRDLRIFIKSYIEGINDKGYNAIYISNLIQQIENQFAEVKYLKFVRINDYDSSVQVIENRGQDTNLLTKEELRDYVPEYLTVRIEDILIDIIRN